MAQAEARISVRISPNAPRNEITGFRDDVLQIKIAAPPVEGKANRALIDFLSESLGVSKGSLAIIKGMTSRQKIISVRGLAQEEIMRKLRL